LIDKKSYYYQSNPTSSIIMVVLLQKENEEVGVKKQIDHFSTSTSSSHFWRALSSFHRHKVKMEQNSMSIANVTFPFSLHF
jgi:hypothetical protein